MSRIRPIAICIIQYQAKILVFKGWDEVKQSGFYRPLGGGIEFGETAQDAVRRELAEEIGAQLSDVRYLFTLENIFTCNGKAGHEIVLVFAADLVDSHLYSAETISGHEDSGEPFQAIWKPLSDFYNGNNVLYPDGLLPRLFDPQ